MTLTLQSTLGSLVAEHPAAAPILYRHRLDFCCGGDQSLASACQARGVAAEAVLAEIGAAVDRDSAENEINWSQRPLDDLIDHILVVYHEPLRRELPELIAMAEKVERVYQLKPGCPHGLAALLQQIHAAVLDHLAKEEQILFPAVRSGRGAYCGGPVACMEAEHDEHGANLARIRELTDDLTPPEGACTTFRVLYQRLDAMEQDLMRHIHLENHILFPRALADEGAAPAAEGEA